MNNQTLTVRQQRVLMTRIAITDGLASNGCHSLGYKVIDDIASKVVDFLFTPDPLIDNARIPQRGTPPKVVTASSMHQYIKLHEHIPLNALLDDYLNDGYPLPDVSHTLMEMIRNNEVRLGVDRQLRCSTNIESEK